ncbi:hypothetical protein [Ferrimonas pelagia]|uniref:Lipocalin-like domain-containing protein n=1 Tax=Ferrimonas pelagia TaxID=1177826 RepID=A0ABP9FBQ1_9GAMM
MKKVLIPLLLLLLPLSAQARLNAQTATEAVKGQWQLLSVQLAGQEQNRYQGELPLWSFDGENFVVEADELNGKVEGQYRILRTPYRLRTTIILISDQLRVTYLPFGKFVFDSLEGDILTFTDWDSGSHYRLQRLAEAG